MKAIDELIKMVGDQLEMQSKLNDVEGKAISLLTELVGEQVEAIRELRIDVKKLKEKK